MVWLYMKRSIGWTLAGAIIYIVFLQYMIYRHSQMEVPQDADYVIVLGARVRGTVPSLSLQYRIDAAAAYLQAHKQTVAIVSGGQGAGEDITEAEAMKRGLIKLGIEESRIIAEGRSTDTRENITYAKQLLPAGMKQGLVVTNDYHVYRAKLIAKKQGLSVAGLPAKTPRISIPKSYLREYAALTKYWLIELKQG